MVTVIGSIKKRHNGFSVYSFKDCFCIHHVENTADAINKHISAARDSTTIKSTFRRVLLNFFFLAQVAVA